MHFWPLPRLYLDLLVAELLPSLFLLFWSTWLLGYALLLHFLYPPKAAWSLPYQVARPTSDYSQTSCSLYPLVLSMNRLIFCAAALLSFFSSSTTMSKPLLLILYFFSKSFPHSIPAWYFPALNTSANVTFESLNVPRLLLLPPRLLWSSLITIPFSSIELLCN